MWATPLGEDRYRLDNVPWFARAFAYGDVVAAEPDHEGVLRVREQLVWSGRYTVRVIPFGDESAEAQLQAVIEEFASLGADCEGALPSFTLIALDIPPTARVAEIKSSRARLPEGGVTKRVHRRSMVSSLTQPHDAGRTYGKEQEGAPVARGFRRGSISCRKEEGAK